MIFAPPNLRLGASRLLRRAARAAALPLVAAGLAAATVPAHAVPSYARQTGMDCSGCHVGAFGPQLTPAGIRFKLEGYTETDGKSGKVPLSGMVVATATRTREDQNPAPEHLKSNDNVKIDEASIFLAGRLGENFGSFMQVTHSGIDHSTALDQMDLRWAMPVKLGGRDTIVGLTLNNNPTVQDPFNTLPVWGAPYSGPEAGFGTGEAGTLINGGLEQRVLGLSAYTLWDKSLYAEFGTYRSLSPTMQARLGLDRDSQRLGGNTYWRLAWMGDQKVQAYSVGIFGWDAKLAPDRSGGTPQDHYRDLGLDASYQFLGTREHVATVNASVIRERLSPGDGSPTTKLYESRLAAGYSWRHTWGGSAVLFDTHGDDPAAATRGQMFQVDWTPWGKEGAEAPSPFGWANLRLGLQWWRYERFGGEPSPHDHDTISLFAWTAF